MLKLLKGFKDNEAGTEMKASRSIGNTWAAYGLNKVMTRTKFGTAQLIETNTNTIQTGQHKKLTTQSDWNREIRRADGTRRGARSVD